MIFVEGFLVQALEGARQLIEIQPVFKAAFSKLLCRRASATLLSLSGA
jgi:hypothetical protein